MGDFDKSRKRYSLVTSLVRSGAPFFVDSESVIYTLGEKGDVNLIGKPLNFFYRKAKLKSKKDKINALEDLGMNEGWHVSGGNELEEDYLTSLEKVYNLRTKKVSTFERVTASSFKD